MKTCTQCQKEYQENTENFYKLKGGRNGLHPSCKSCFNSRTKQNQKNKPDLYAKLKHEYYVKNKDKLLAGRKQWAIDNIERVRIYRIRSESKRRIIMKQTDVYTEEQWEKVCEQYNYTCVRCYKVPVKLTRDHIVPVSLGGTNHISNMQPLCGPCNSSKRDNIKDYAHWFMVA